MATDLAEERRFFIGAALTNALFVPELVKNLTGEKERRNAAARRFEGVERR